MFGGGVDVSSGNLTAQEIASLKASHSLSKAVLQGDMVVDFDGVLKAFLSSNSPSWFIPEDGSDTETKRRVHVIRNFLNYLLHHDVCPEHAEQIQAARETCDVGEAQLSLIGKSCRMLPGQFNVACSTLFGGWYNETYNHSGDWGADDTINASSMTLEQAKKCFIAGMASNSSPQMFEKYQEHTAASRKQPLRQFRTGFEVTELKFADREVKHLYRLPQYQAYKCVGKVKARTWYNPASYAEDLTEEEEKERANQTREISEYEFWLEEEVMEMMFQGMKLEAEVYETTFGMYFFDTVSQVACSFFSFIPNDMMDGWREHVYLPPRDSYEPKHLEVYSGEE